ncbi:MAG: type II toxin-antitoxin system RelE/ParE family toxin [Ignavibacteriae bacterium]|nr:type II toxin-antitoxin system RelE/ParE family toxin [Ignavibacteriota bacterium]
MRRKIIFFGNYFYDFYNRQNKKVREKINWTLGIIRDLDIIPEKYFKHIEGTNLYEIRVSIGNNIFRIFCFFDKGNLVVVLNGFQKKSQKTPKQEIQRAIKIKELYFEEQKK